jgi:hypothetical protein
MIVQQPERTGRFASHGRIGIAQRLDECRDRGSVASLPKHNGCLPAYWCEA